MTATFEYSNEYLSQRLRRAGLRPSTARVHVMSYLEKNRNHPTVDQIYKALLNGLPGLSRASVYNSLSALERAGLVRPLTMDGNELRYDSFVGDHGHFCCRECGMIYDFDMPRMQSAAGGLSGFQIERQDFLVWGLCSDCAGKRDS